MNFHNMKVHEKIHMNFSNDFQYSENHIIYIISVFWEH